MTLLIIIYYSLSVTHFSVKYFFFLKKFIRRYKICTADPQGDELLDNWAQVSGNFSQSFFIDLETCRLAMSDRLITIEVVDRDRI